MSNKLSRSRDQGGQSPVIHNYVYDSVYRMVESDVDGSGTIGYNLDGVGNRASVSGAGGGAYVMDDTDPPLDQPANQYTVTVRSHREYDKNGNLISVAVMCDQDGDGDVDYGEFSAFQLCFSGPGVPAGAECHLFDYDSDGDVDLLDWGDFSLLYGPQPASEIRYDYRNQMVKFIEEHASSADVITEYAYDALGRRIVKRIDAGSQHEALPRFGAIIKRNHDLPAPFADASRVYFAERRRIGTGYTLDRRDFAVYRRGSGEPFTILSSDLQARSAGQTP